MRRASRRLRPFLHRPAASRPELRSRRLAAPPRRLRRIISQKKIAGVCAGFAEYFDTDLTLMRVIWVALLLLPPQSRFDRLHRVLGCDAESLSDA